MSILEDVPAGVERQDPAHDHRAHEVGGTAVDASKLYDVPVTMTEAERLERMAAIFDPISLKLIAELADVRVETTVVDVGAGDSTSLGRRLDNYGYGYIPVDQRPDATKKHGPNALQALATDIPVTPAELREHGGEVLTHCRFTLGWIKDAEKREQVLSELLRLAGSQEQAKMAFTDYDWSVCEGPVEFMEAVKLVTLTLKMQGFDPEYGSRLHDDVKELFGELASPDSVSVSEPLRESVHNGPIGQALTIIKIHTDAIIVALRRMGREKDASKMEQVVESFKQYAEDKPATKVRLPDAVSVTCRVKTSGISKVEQELHAARNQYLSELPQSQLERGDMIVTPATTRSLEHTIALDYPGNELLVAEARRLQAASYLDQGLIDRKALDANGQLKQETDSLEISKRSRHFLALDADEKNILAMVRLIWPDETGSDSLMTIARLKKDGHEQVLTDAGLLDDNVKIAEISALSRGPMGGTMQDLLRAVLCMVAEVHQENELDYYVMSIQENAYRALKKLFGDKAFPLLGTNDNSYTIDKPGARDARYLTVYVHAKDFAGLAYEHLDKMEDDKKTADSIWLKKALGEILEANQ